MKRRSCRLALWRLTLFCFPSPCRALLRDVNTPSEGGSNALSSLLPFPSSARQCRRSPRRAADITPCANADHQRNGAISRRVIRQQVVYACRYRAKQRFLLSSLFFFAMPSRRQYRLFLSLSLLLSLFSPSSFRMRMSIHTDSAVCLTHLSCRK